MPVYMYDDTGQLLTLDGESMVPVLINRPAPEVEGGDE